LDRYRGYLRYLADRKLGDLYRRRIDASDVVQEVLLAAQRAFGEFRGETEPEISAWLVRILERKLANARRDHRAPKRDMAREQAPAGESATLSWNEPPSDGSSPSQRLVRGENALRLAAALDSLPDDQRHAVRLRHLENLPIAEIAARLDRSTAAVAGLLRRGLKALQDQLSHESW
jgi:RNA polymerase sigma-70 factor (ECF subfamily)